jgi:hypothetical protein
MRSSFSGLSVLRVLLLAVISSPAGACAPFWNSGNRTTLTADVREILDRGEVDPDRLECNMLGTTRSGLCLFDTTETEIQELTAGLGLGQWQLTGQTEAANGSLAAEAGKGCLTSEFFGGRTDLLQFGIAGRPDELELSDGGQFEYFILLFDPNTGEACIQVAYSYG